MPSPDPNPQPRNQDLLIPWLLVAGLFTISLITAIATLLQGMARLGIDGASLPWWYHPLLLLSECGLAISIIGILILVIVSFRKAAKTQ